MGQPMALVQITMVHSSFHYNIRQLGTYISLQYHILLACTALSVHHNNYTQSNLDRFIVHSCCMGHTSFLSIATLASSA